MWILCPGSSGSGCSDYFKVCKPDILHELGTVGSMNKLAVIS